MVWKNYIVKQLDLVNRSTSKESDLYGAYNTLLHNLFPPSKDYQVVPQFRPYTGSVDYTISYIVLKVETPIFFVEIKTFVAFKLPRARAAADNQMRSFFLDFAGDRLPQSNSLVSAPWVLVLLCMN